MATRGARLQALLKVLHGSYGQGKSGEKSENFTFQSQGKLRGSGKVGENQNTREQKLTKMQKTQVSFFLLTSLADYLCLYFYICSTALVPSVITGD